MLLGHADISTTTIYPCRTGRLVRCTRSTTPERRFESGSHCVSPASACKCAQFTCWFDNSSAFAALANASSLALHKLQSIREKEPVCLPMHKRFDNHFGDIDRASSSGMPSI